jgi:predicted transcriptional regulator
MAGRNRDLVWDDLETAHGLKLSERQRRLLDELAAKPSIGVRELARAVGRAASTVLSELRELQDLKVIWPEVCGECGGVRWRY